MEATLAVFDVSGRRVATLAHGRLSAGRHTARWSGRDERGVACGPGLYFARLRSAQGAHTVKLVRNP